MTGGVIAGNTVNGNGDGLAVQTVAATVSKTGSVIYGNEASAALRNYAGTGGHAANVQGTPPNINTTLWESDNLP